MVQRWRISSNSQQSDRCGEELWGCLWWFKDEEFQAIHNDIIISRKRAKLSMMVQRWRISSNSQPVLGDGSALHGCLWWFKDEEFQAIHNLFNRLSITFIVVYDGSKMKNFKQFTTFMFVSIEVTALSMMVQRWRISSNSQQKKEKETEAEGCLWWFKDEEFQAIHNALKAYLRLRPLSMMVQRWRISSNSQQRAGFINMNTVVYDGSKMKNFKQFTTRPGSSNE